MKICRAAALHLRSGDFFIGEAWTMGAFRGAVMFGLFAEAGLRLICGSDKLAGMNYASFMGRKAIII